MSDLVELKPCPFCGCTDISNKDDGHTQWFECAWCGATSGYDPSPEFEGEPASWHWNRRAAITAMPRLDGETDVAERCAKIADDLANDELFLDEKGRFGAELVAASIRAEFSSEPVFTPSPQIKEPLPAPPASTPKEENA